VPLVNSLLTAIVRSDGDALVLHASERPYIVTPTGQKELASRVLTLEAMTGMVNELLPPEARKTLDEVGAVQNELSRRDIFPDERFTIVAARGGDDIWIEIRRLRVPGAAAHETGFQAPGMQETPHQATASVNEPPAPVMHARESHEPSEAQIAPQPPQPAGRPAPEGSSVREAPQESLEQEIHLQDSYDRGDDQETVYELDSSAANDDMSVLEPTPALESGFRKPPADVLGHRPPADFDREPERDSAVVLQIARNNVRQEQTVRLATIHTGGIDRLLRIAAARGASTLYLTSQARPTIRVDGEISAIEGEALLSEAEVEALMLDIIPERNRETLRNQAGTEWICDVPDVGRIRCVTFRDHRGAGGIFRMIPARAISAEQLGLSREIQGLCAEAEGLVLVTGPRASGKSTLISAFVDLINRTRSDHVITLENQIKFVHENRGSLVSQREVRGDNNELMSVARAALRENPDVLVIEDFGSPEIVTLALEAAQSGHLIIGALTAHTATDAVDRIIDQTPPDRRPKIQLGLAENLRGIVAQVLLRKSGGGRVAAREVLLNTSAVANLIAEGKTSQLRTALDSGRKHGMVPLNDALVAFVENGIVDSREAYRQAADQQGFLALLKRQGIDTSFVERLA
jgi:twitching motility protein PilT